MNTGAVSILVKYFPRLLRKFLLQLFLARQIELIFPGVDVGVFGQGNFNQRLVFFLAQHDADGGAFSVGFNETQGSSLAITHF